jgi:hypothetical protein
MHYKSLTRTVALVAILVVAPSVSRAGDYCLTFPNEPSFTLVGRGFTIPPKGKCKAWIGFSSQDNSNNPSTGTGCTSSDGSNLSIGITTMEGDIVLFDSASMALPAQTGTDDETAVDGGSVSGPVNGAQCKPSSNPIPAIASGQRVTRQVGLMSR